MDLTTPAERSPYDGADRLGVLRTKLAPPGPRQGLITRPRIVDRLATATTRLLAIIAPAGYGKSSVAAEYARTAGRPVAWLSADPRDADPATLARGIAAAIAGACPVPDDVLDRIADPGASPWSVAVPALATAISSIPALTLVVDDVQRLTDDEAIDVLLGLLGSLPPDGRMLVVGRTPGRLPLARLEAAGLSTIFGREDLAFDEGEVERALVASGIAVEAPVSAAILASTEGWAAGVYLTALASAGRADRPGPAGAGVSPTAPERMIEEYLRTEVLATMTPDDADLLVRASVVDRWSGPLCDALLERDGSGATLDRLERTNLFLIPLDAERTWYRPHHLLGDLFRADLERRAPEEARRLLQRAATWHLEQGMAEQALEYAIQAEDEAMAARLVIALSQATLNAGRYETARRWFDWFDDRGVGRRDMRFAAMATLVFSLGGDAERAVRWGAIADAAEPVDPIDVGARAVARCCLFRDGTAVAETDADDAVRFLPPDDPLAVAALVGVGVSRTLAGRTDAAMAAFEAALEGWGRRPTVNLSALVAMVHLAAIGFERGDRAAAEAHVRQARATLIDSGLSEQPIAAAVDALDARVAIGHGAIEQARRSLAHAQRLRIQTGVAAPWLAMRARFDLIRVLLALGDGGGARTIVAEVRELLVARPDLGTLVDEARELGERVEGLRGGVAGANTLTMAELRLLPLLTTHLTFREIGERLFVTQNTIKTQALSIYRKLDATSRSEAVERATAVGLLGPSSADRFIPHG